MTTPQTPQERAWELRVMRIAKELQLKYYAKNPTELQFKNNLPTLMRELFLNCNSVGF